jgi:outer membrane protein assembly factor BamB
VAFGGLYGDCDQYLGWVVGTTTDGQGPLLAFHVPTTREGGIWAASGPAIDGTGQIYVAVGNGAATSGDWYKSDSILHLSPALDLLDGFAPEQWAIDNADDADLGSMGPVLLPDGSIIADGKSGDVYLLHSTALGGVGGEVQTLPICHAYGGAATVGMIAYLPCTDGVRAIQVAQNQMSIAWHAAGPITGSPVAGGHTLYSLNPAGTLYALDIATGMVRTKLALPPTSHFATPTLFGSAIFVGTLTGIAAIAVISA